MSGEAAPKPRWTVIEWAALAAAATLVMLPLATPFMVWGWCWSRDHAHERHGIRDWTPLAVISVVCLALTGRWYADGWLTLAAALVGERGPTSWWLAVVAMAPLSIVGGYLTGLAARPAWMIIRGRHTLDGRSRREAEAERVRALITAPGGPAANAPLTIDDRPVLGARLDGDGDNTWTRDRWATLDPGVAHLVAVGVSGAGKTETILRLAAAHQSLGWQVIAIDAKEDHEVSDRFAALASDHGVPVERIRRWPAAGHLDLFRGTPSAIHDRLMACAAWTEPFYRAVASTILVLVCDDPAGPPRSFGELISRLDPAAIKTRWAGTARAQVAAAINPQDIQGVRYRFFSLEANFTAVGATSHHDAGWSWEDSDATWITLPTSTRSETAAALGRTLLVDLIAYLRDPTRRIDPRPILLIVEELGAIVSADPATATLVIEAVERARSARVRTILSVQTPEGLGAPDAQARILHGGAAVLAHRMPQPEPIAELLGTSHALEASLGIDAQGAYLDHGSVREQHQWRLPPGRIRSLPVGQAVLVHAAGWTQVAVGRVQPSLGPSA